MVPLRQIFGSVVRSPSGPSAQPSGIGLPSRARFATSLLATTLALWSITIDAPPFPSGTAIDQGLVPSTGLRPPDTAIEEGALVKPRPRSPSPASLSV